MGQVGGCPWLETTAEDEGGETQPMHLGLG